MKNGSSLLLAAALFTSVVGLQSTTASAMPLAHVDAAVSTTADGAKIDHVRWCNWRGCYGGYGYGYRVYNYGYRPYAYYRPYGYRYGWAGPRFGFY